MLARQGACEQTGDLPVAVLEGVDDEKVEDKQAGQEHRGFPADRVSTAARPGRVAGGRGAPASSGEAAVELMDMVAFSEQAFWFLAGEAAHSDHRLGRGHVPTGGSSARPGG